MTDYPEELESYECGDCGNKFFVEYIGDLQGINMANYCCFCGVPFEYYLGVDDEAET